MSDKADLLKLLEERGQQFLQSFGTSVAVGKCKDEKSRNHGERSPKRQRLQEDIDEEWSGIGKDEDDATSDEDMDMEHRSSAYDDAETAGQDSTDEDDDFQYGSHSRQPDVIVFAEVKASSLIPKGSKSGFMSSKVTKLTQEVQHPQKQALSPNEDDDPTNAQNDALLHRLVHTKLLSGSLNPDLNLTSAQRKKALAGRVMEAAGKVKLGKGEAAVRQAEHNRAAKHVRDGLSEKRKEKQQKELEEAKHSGNYHPALKSLYDASSTSKRHNRKRERGMKMGVGSFKGGILRLTKDDIGVLESRHSTSRGRGGHRRGNR